MFKLKATAEELEIAKKFMGAIPASFSYDDVPFPKGFNGENGVYVSEDGVLKCEMPFVTYENSAAVEWLPRFSCIGNGKTGQVKDVLALDTVFETDGEAELYYTNGCVSTIEDFALKTTKITDEAFELESNGSRHHLPFFNLKTGNGGVILGLGFTGNWKAVFTPVEKGIRVTVHMGETNFHLLPGESFRNILMLALFWKGDIRRSFNLLRNHLVLNYIPKDESGEPCPPICCQTWGGMKTHNHLKYLKFIEENNLKFDCYWIDAGWHGPDHETDEFQDNSHEDWIYSQGDWTPNRCVHPDGIKPISDAAHRMGMKVLLWFGTFACIHNIGWHAEHPEWAADDHTEPMVIAEYLPPLFGHDINLDIPEAKEWLIDRVVTTMKENGCDWFREDSGINIKPDTEGRIGIGAMKKAQYFYDVLDGLRERMPKIFIDICGGGGSRIDLETLKRGYILWRSDYNCNPYADPIGAQVGNHGMGHFVPLANCAPPSNPGNTYTFHSGLYGGMGFPLFHPVGFGEPEKHTWMADDYPVEWHRRMIEHYQVAKRYFSGSFYALTPCTTDRSDVLAYQFDRPDLDGGIIIGFFRPECEKDSFEINPVIPNGRYRFEDVESGEVFENEISGNAQIKLYANEKPHSVLLHYKKI